jgi:hypothetical protein
MPSQEDIENQRTLLVTHRATLQLLLNQHAQFGAAYVPQHIWHGLRETRGQIKKCKDALRGWGEQVEDLPNDEEFSAVGQLNDALHDVANLMYKPSLRSDLSIYQETFDFLNNQIIVLKIYKDLHDQLHQLHFGCYRLIVIGARQFPRSRSFIESLRLYTISLQQIVDSLWEIAERPRFPGNERRWIEQLAQVHELLVGAIETRRREPFDLSLFQIERVISLQPTRINERLKAIARSLPFEQLTRAMIMAQASNALEVDGKSTTDTITQGLTALEQLRTNLNQILEEHDTWQRFEPDLRQYESNPLHYLQRFTWLWNADLKPSLDELYRRRNDRWTRELQRVGERLDQALAAPTASALTDSCQAFYSSFGKCFFQADKELQEQCNQLRMIDGPLKSIIRMFV